jgi:hypothetical protein
LWRMVALDNAQCYLLFHVHILAWLHYHAECTPHHPIWVPLKWSIHNSFLVLLWTNVVDEIWILLLSTLTFYQCSQIAVGHEDPKWLCLCWQ